MIPEDKTILTLCVIVIVVTIATIWLLIYSGDPNYFGLKRFI